MATEQPALLQALVVIGRHGRWVLPLGLLAALLLPAVAEGMQSAIGPLLAALLLVSFLQIKEPQPNRAEKTWLAEFKPIIILLACFQIILPLMLVFLMRALLVPDAWMVPVALVAAASCITGGPSIVMMLRGNGVMAIRLLVCSTLALPVTALPVLALLPIVPSYSMLLKTALMLALVILGAYLIAKVLRKFVLGSYTESQKSVLDGVAAILLAMIVLGLMAAIHSAWDKPALLLTTLFWACVVNIGFQCIGLFLNTLFCLKLPIMCGVMGGNRAVAIFLTALPESVYQPYLLFIACYQIPMYLTPLLGGYFYRRYKDDGS